MRKDVANLLERLGKREFHYQEFADRFTDVELWPIFETLIRDPRILATAQHTSLQKPAAAHVRQAAAPVALEDDMVIAPAPAQPLSPPPVKGDLAAVLARYGGQPDVTAEDIHALLQRLASQLEQGKI